MILDKITDDQILAANKKYAQMFLLFLAFALFCNCQKEFGKPVMKYQPETLGFNAKTYEMHKRSSVRFYYSVRAGKDKTKNMAYLEYRVRLFDNNGELIKLLFRSAHDTNITELDTLINIHPDSISFMATGFGYSVSDSRIGFGTTRPWFSDKSN